MPSLVLLLLTADYLSTHEHVTDTMSHHLSELLKEVIPYYLERDDLEGLAEDLAIYVSKLLNTETPCKDMHAELSSDLLFLKEIDD